MLLYTSENRFCPRTGKKLDPVQAADGDKAICDYTGEIFDLEDDTLTPYYNLSIEYNHDSEPSWYQDHYDFKKLFPNIGYGDFSQFMDSPYHFMHTEEYGSADNSWFLIDEWYNARRGKDKKHRFYECGTLEQAMQRCRLDTAIRLLKENKVTLELLGFVNNEDTYN